MHHKVQKLQKSMTSMKHGKACYWGSKQKTVDCHCFETKVMLRPDIHRKTLFFDRSTLRQPRHFASYTSCAEESWHTHVQCQGNRCTGWKSNILPANKASVRFLLLYQSQQDTFLAFENQSPWHTPQFKTIWMFFSTRQIFANLNLVPCSRIARLRWVSHVLELCFLGRTFQPWKTFFTTWRIFFKSGCAFNPLAVFRRCKHFFNFTVLFSACCPSSFQLREAFFLPCLVPLGFFVRLLSRHGGDAQTWHYFKYRGRRSIWWMSWKVAEASQKSYFLSSVKMALQEKLARNRQVSICQCIGCPSHRRWSTLATTSSGTCHSQQK